MKDLKLTYNGGHRLRIDDLNHLQAGLKEILTEIGNSLITGNQPAILYGAEITEVTGNTQVTAGLLFIDGEHFPIAAATIAGVMGVDLEYQVVEDFIAPSPVLYEDLSNNNVHRVRKAILGRSSARPGNYVQGYVPSAFKRISNNWVTPALNSNWIQKDPNLEGLNLQYNMDYFQRKVELRGVCHYTTPIPGAVIFNLPVQFRPAVKTIRHLFVSSNMGGVGFAPCYCTIATNGDVSVDIGLGAGKAYHLDGVYYYL